MKFRKTLSFVLVLILALGVLPVTAFAYTAPSSESVANELTDANETIIWDTSFELANGKTVEDIELWDSDTRKYVAADFAGTYNIGTGNAGMVDTGGKTSAYQNFFYDSEKATIVFKAGSGSSSANKAVQINPQTDPAMTSLVASFDIEMKSEAMTRQLSFALIDQSGKRFDSVAIAMDRKISVGSEKLNVELPVDKIVNLTIHYKADKETLAIVYDVYVDGVMVKEDVAFATATGATYSFNYFWFLQTYGDIEAATIDPESGNAVALPDAEGQEIYRLHALRVYYSDECYETVHGTEPCNFNTYKNVGTSGHKVACACGKTTGDVIAHFDNGYGKCDCEAGITDVSVSISSDLSLNYYADIVDKSLLANGAVPTLKIGGTTITNYTVKDGKYVFSYDGIGPHQVGNKLDAVLYVGDTAVAGKLNFSVEDYCKAALDIYEDDTVLVDLIHDLLAYAREADKYKNEKTESNIASDLELNTSTVIPTENDDVIGTSDYGRAGLYVYSAGVYFDCVNRIYFKICSENGAPTVSIDGALCSAELVEGETNLYIVYSSPIAPMDFDTARTLTLLEDGKTEAVATLTYSVNTYAYYMQSDSAMSNLALALYRYGKSCEKLNPSIIYNTNGGILPDGAPEEYDTVNGTPLPTPTRDGFVFGGWFTSEDLTGESISAIPAGTQRAVTVYAKWLTVIADNDFTGVSASVENGNKTINGVNYNSAKSGILIETATDEEENTYLKVSHTGVHGMSFICTYANPLDTAAGQEIKEGIVSLEFKVKKIEGVDLSNLRIVMKFSDASDELPFTIGTTAGATYTKDEGSAENEIKFVGGSAFATITETEYTTIRLAYNMSTGQITSYDENGNVLASQSFAASTGALLYVNIYAYNLNVADSADVIENSAVAIDDIKIIDGNAYAN